MSAVARLGGDLADLPPELRYARVMKELARRQAVERDREEMPKSLSKFTRGAWSVIEPGTPYLHNWHIDAICEHLEALVHGQIRNLLITMPPRHMKSICSSVMLPTWLWTFRPEFKFLFSSYAHSLSIRDALKSRRLIQSEWYQDRWGDVFELTGDQNAKMRYENDSSGYRIATSVGGTATGEGGDIICCDDPHNMKEIHSDVIREGVLDWWDNVMSTRLNNPKTGAKIIIMQRGHEGDLAGHVLRKGNWEHLNLPAEYELSTRKTSLGWSDPRKEKGELLWPERFGKKELEALKTDMTSYAVAGQLQQRPAPEEGGIFKRGDFQLWPADVKLPMLEYVVQSYDTGFTEKTMNDPTAHLALGIFKHPRYGYNCVMICDAWRDRVEYPALRKRVRLDVRAKYGEKGMERRPDVVLVEEKGSGIVLLQDLRLIGVPAYGYNPGKSDKIVRANAAAPFVASRRVFLLESGKNRGQPVSWVEEFLHEILTFPNALHDDFVDAFTQAIILLRNNQLLEAKIPGAEEDDEPLPAEEPANPYAQ